MTDLEKLLAVVTPGEWTSFIGETYKVRANGMNIATMNFVTLLDRLPERQVAANARLIAMSPTLARKVIAAEKLADALAEVAADLAIGAHPELHKTQINDALAAWEAEQ